jgi:hypothetical protein
MGDDIKLDFQDMYGDVVWIDLAQDRDKWQGFVNTVMNLWVL